ncbi:fimbria/pilus outer membrane usher protein [Methylocapsa aurea]|uniref:fimbria/pilus outer membrane usher protein n=1 Tax=Methylocapsa aurea TaxID=663610 RepID=UPI0012EB3E5C|nr:fimbria/pilus outer membrane usher protein [Methylocapsa aurea]
MRRIDEQFDQQPQRAHGFASWIEAVFGLSDAGPSRLARLLSLQAKRGSTTVVAVAILLAAIHQVLAEDAFQQLQLEVFINDEPTKLIGSFTSVDGRRLGARGEELEEIGLSIGAAKVKDGFVVLEEIEGLTYRYDEPGQRIYLTITDSLRKGTMLDASPRREKPPAAGATFGGVLNYNLLGVSNGRFNWSTFGFAGLTASLDARAFSPFGTLSQSVIAPAIGAGVNGGNVLRLNTDFTYSDQNTLTTYRAGDVINGGLAWTRPIRIGGFQAQRNFGLRPDLVTVPLASASGSAAVPSTVDLYINNLKTFSHDVGIGPYSITNIPIVTGGGEARIVVRDAAGHETQSSLPFYASSSLLAPGLFDFSLEAGFPRFGFGTTLDAYIAKPVASGSWRQGISDWLTLESHAEGGAGLANAGIGAVASVGGFGVASLALAGSRSNFGVGLQSYASVETRIGPVSLTASSQMSHGAYQDLASLMGRFQSGGLQRVKTLFGLLQYDVAFANATSYPPLFLNYEPPKMINRLSVGTPLPFDNGSFSASYIDLREATGNTSRILSASYSRPLAFDATLSATVFTDFGARRNAGLYFSLSVPLGDQVTAASGFSTGQGGRNAIVGAQKPLGQEPGSYGWRFGAGEGGSAVTQAAASYRSPYGWAEAGVVRNRRGSTSATAQIDGAIATTGSDILFTNRIDDSFAVVETGAPNVAVLYENRPVGSTDSAGRLVLPNLRSYQSNKIAIDPRNLPVNADVASTQTVVAPAGRAGVRVNFGVETNNNVAILVLSTPDGKPIPAGSQGEIDGGQAFVVGYDGRAYVKGLARENALVVKTVSGTCRASFSYAGAANEQAVIPVTCR